MKIRQVLLLALCLSPLGESTHASETGSRVAATLLNTWTDADVSILAKPEDAEALKKLREIAMSSEDSRAQVVLLNFGDPAVVTWWLAQMTSDDVRERSRALSLGRSVRNPALLLALEPLLLREESSTDILVADDVASPARSVIAAFCIVNFIRKSEEFPEGLKTWSRSYNSNDELRTALRRWMAENRELLKAAKFSELKPLK